MKGLKMLANGLNIENVWEEVFKTPSVRDSFIGSDSFENNLMDTPPPPETVIVVGKRRGSPSVLNDPNYIVFIAKLSITTGFYEAIGVDNLQMWDIEAVVPINDPPATRTFQDIYGRTHYVYNKAAVLDAINKIKPYMSVATAGTAFSQAVLDRLSNFASKVSPELRMAVYGGIAALLAYEAWVNSRPSNWELDTVIPNNYNFNPVTIL